jgi:hypothetical protein
MASEELRKKWLGNYLLDRSQFVEFDNNTSVKIKFSGA